MSLAETQREKVFIASECWNCFCSDEGGMWARERSIFCYSYEHYAADRKSHARVAVCWGIDFGWAKSFAGTAWPRQWSLHSMDQLTSGPHCTHPTTDSSTVFRLMPALSGGIWQHLLLRLIVIFHMNLCYLILPQFSSSVCLKSEPFLAQLWEVFIGQLNSVVSLNKTWSTSHLSQMLSTVDQWQSLVYHTDHLPLCTAQLTWCSASCGIVCHK